MTDKPQEITAPTATPNGNGSGPGADFVFDIQAMNMTLAERRIFRKAMLEATQAGGGLFEDERPLLAYLVKWLKHWPYAGDPANVESYDNLRLSEWQEVIRQMTAAFQKAIG